MLNNLICNTKRRTIVNRWIELVTEWIRLIVHPLLNIREAAVLLFVDAPGRYLEIRDNVVWRADHFVISCLFFLFDILESHSSNPNEELIKVAICFINDVLPNQFE